MLPGKFFLLRQARQVGSVYPPQVTPLKGKQTPKLLPPIQHIPVCTHTTPKAAGEPLHSPKDLLPLGEGQGSGCPRRKIVRGEDRNAEGLPSAGRPGPGAYLGEVEPVERVALLLHPLHGPCALPHALGLLGQVQVEHGHAPGAHIRLRERVHHQHHPHGPLALPVARDGVEQVVGVQPLAPLCGCHPGGHHQLHVVQVALQAPVEIVGQHILQVLPVGQQLAAGQSRDGVGVCQVQLKVDAGTGLEGCLGVVWDKVPDTGVGDVDGAKQIGRGVAPNSPQEGVEVPLLQGERSRKAVRPMAAEQTQISTEVAGGGGDGRQTPAQGHGKEQGLWEPKDPQADPGFAWSQLSDLEHTVSLPTDSVSPSAKCRVRVPT